jgi:uncharacterized membrane protein YgcG
VSRRIAYRPSLDLAIRAREPLLPRQKLRPYAMIERRHNTRLTAKTKLGNVNSASLARQVAYTNDGGKIARRSIRMAAASTGGGGGGGGGPGGGGGGGGGWPF